MAATELTPDTGHVRARALAAFRAGHEGEHLAPVGAVTPALDEADCLGEVLAEVPATACGERVETLVVDDGSTDGTEAVARAAGVRVARLERNCGHGVA